MAPAAGGPCLPGTAPARAARRLRRIRAWGPRPPAPRGGSCHADEKSLTHEEWGVIVDLLEEEANELPVEIHRSRSLEVRERLRRRKEIVRRSLEGLVSPVES